MRLNAMNIGRQIKKFLMIKGESFHMLASMRCVQEHYVF